MIPSIAASGMSLLAAADRLFGRSAGAFARAATDPALDTLTSAAFDLLDGRSSFRMGVALIETSRDTEQHLLDVIA